MCLLDEGVKTNEILVFTFTEKAAAELKDRIHTVLEADGINTQGMAEMYVGTMHGYALDLVQRLVPELSDAVEAQGYSRDLCSYARADLGSVVTGRTPVGRIQRHNARIVFVGAVYGSCSQTKHQAQQPCFPINVLAPCKGIERKTDAGNLGIK